MKRLDNVSYEYKHLSVQGGGFVTGFLFHPLCDKVLYARTDIGGIYRYDFDAEHWISLSETYNEFQRSYFKPSSLAVDYDNENVLFAMCGNNIWSNPAVKDLNNLAVLLISDDFGDSFTEKKVLFRVDGNYAARLTDERLAYHDGMLFFGSQRDGLFRSSDLGDTWEKLDFPENDITFVRIQPSQNIIFIGCTGENQAIGDVRGHTLYASYDNGVSFAAVDTPEALMDERCFYKGFVPVAISFNDTKAIVSFSCSHTDSYAKWDSFACDNGGGFDGRVYCYDLHDGKIVGAHDRTPSIAGFIDENPVRRLPFGLGGIEITHDSIFVCSIGGHGEAMFVSRDNGMNYDVVFNGENIEKFIINTPYQKPEYNGGRIPIHWMSSFRVSPHDNKFGLFNTGTGVFVSKNLTADAENIMFETFNNGIEETVHLNIYGVSKGKNKVIDIIGDLGGFAFRDLDLQCENSFADSNGNRYITCNNADYIVENPDIFVCTARGNWTGVTKGGLIYTVDGGDNSLILGIRMGLARTLILL